MKYEITVTVPAGSLFKPVAELERSLQESMDSFGVSDKIKFMTEIPHILTVNRSLSSDEKVAVIRIVEESYREGLDKDCRVKDFEPLWC